MANYGELGYLLAQQRAGMGNQGAASLGYLLGGGGRAQEQQIFNRSALEGARMQDVLAQARQRQQAGIEHDNQIAARHSLSNRYRSSGNPELADMFDAYDNPEQIAMARENLLKGNALSRAIDLANSPTIDYDRLNAIKMATANGPTQLVRNLGNGSYTGNAYVTNPDVQVSDIGKAFIGEKNAQAARARAGIGADKASNYEIVDTPTGKMRVNKLNPSDTMPVLFNGKPVAKPAAAGKGFTKQEMAAAFGPGPNGTGVDPDKFTRFQAYRKNAPNDTDAFLQMHDDDQYAAQGMGPPAPPQPGILDSISSLFGGGKQAAQPAASTKPNLQDWMTKAKQANPGVSDDELTAYYNKKYGG